MATTTTTQAGDWNTAGNWDAGVPTVADDAVVEHAMDIDGTGATFASLDNNSTITFSATADVVVKDAGVIDNAGGTINASNQDITFKASTGITKWSVLLYASAGTFTWGTGEIHFENAILQTNTNSATYIDAGDWYFDEDCDFESSNASGGRFVFRSCTAVTFAAGKTFQVYNSNSSICALELACGTATLDGSSGNEITINSGAYSGTGTVVFKDLSTSLTMNYVDISDVFGINLTSYDGTNTLSHCTISNCSYGVYGYTTAASSSLTVSNCEIYNITIVGVQIGNSCAADFEIDLEDTDIYSCSAQGYYQRHRTYTGTMNMTRVKIYGCTSSGLLLSDYDYPLMNVSSSLFYEQTGDNVVLRRIGTANIINCTSTDPGPTTACYWLDTNAGDTFNLTNCIGYNGNWCVEVPDASGTINITYCDMYGGTASNYTGMTDPTGTNGNISADPLFTDAASDDYSLGSALSPCVNTGTNTGAPATDINGIAWPNPYPEIGCYSLMIPVKSPFPCFKPTGTGI